ncbi:hypothetical protein J2W42_005886 [Rhizobium tibeticum]|uniref:hypothetical protein n=1 Tax=Rhizobium tibeticum TaxID=501024 RepID=UPI002786B13D|nr:hypothetical protein [Rhizobium tibeticum]MDP9813015.1 hypothetical protein [Rhizobium tibeticum]
MPIRRGLWDLPREHLSVATEYWAIRQNAMIDYNPFKKGIRAINLDRAASVGPKFNT